VPGQVKQRPISMITSPPMVDNYQRPLFSPMSVF
jgi:hypothetical protein